ncbi:DUF317 domain-containing protein [Streptomyces poonensis]|uniref:DUF317 domain-containing protein n=1 Tax=Streptomyces poonensis TaxID=68255 RepID=A0A918UXR1_9ACTN|nr:DUF317 domain-containing protein [Streptomyces poonensis]GGZ40430.1 hypothetical protein GCM10010365_71480 [Streptomyces poonensis]GLJ93025.1 hypothetical protein GCM10017589_56370 [Streptomyces poonensis]
MPRVLLSSPDQQALLRLEPAPDGQRWTLHHASGPDRPAWYVSFGAHTPVEITAGFTDALTDPTADPANAGGALEPLLGTGWPPASNHNRLVSPDGTVRVDLHEPTGA